MAAAAAGRVVAPRCVLLWRQRSKFVFFSSSWAPAKRAAADRRAPPSSPLQRPGQAGDENTPPPVRIAPQAPAEKRTRRANACFFVAAWQRGGPCQVASFFLFSLIKAAPVR